MNIQSNLVFPFKITDRMRVQEMQFNLMEILTVENIMRD